MYRLFLITVLTLSLTACSSPSNSLNIDDELYSDAETLAQTFYEEAENSKEISMNNSLDDEINKFNAKYDKTEDKWSNEEQRFIFDVELVYINYTDYSLYKEPDKLEDFYDQLDKLKTEYGMEI